MSPARWARCAAVAAAAFVAILVWIAARRGAPTTPDVRVQYCAYTHRVPLLDAASLGFHYAGGFAAAVGIGLAAAILAWARGRRRIALGIVATLVALGAALQTVKTVVGRERPDPARRLVRQGGGSFPSGHAAGTMALALIGASQGYRVLRSGAARHGLAAGLVALSVATGLSRILLGVHYLSDVAAGWFLGAAFFFANWIWVDRPPKP